MGRPIFPIFIVTSDSYKFISLNNFTKAKYLSKHNTTCGSFIISANLNTTLSHTVSTCMANCSPVNKFISYVYPANKQVLRQGRLVVINELATTIIPKFFESIFQTFYHWINILGSYFSQNDYLNMLDLTNNLFSFSNLLKHIT